MAAGAIIGGLGLAYSVYQGSQNSGGGNTSPYKGPSEDLTHLSDEELNRRMNQQKSSKFAGYEQNEAGKWVEVENATEHQYSEDYRNYVAQEIRRREGVAFAKKQRWGEIGSKTDKFFDDIYTQFEGPFVAPQSGEEFQLYETMKGGFAPLQDWLSRKRVDYGDFYQKALWDPMNQRLAEQRELIGSEAQKLGGRGLTETKIMAEEARKAITAGAATQAGLELNEAQMAEQRAVSYAVPLANAMQNIFSIPRLIADTGILREWQELVRRDNSAAQALGIAMQYVYAEDNLAQRSIDNQRNVDQMKMGFSANATNYGPVIGQAIATLAEAFTPATVPTDGTTTTTPTTNQPAGPNAANNWQGARIESDVAAGRIFDETQGDTRQTGTTIQNNRSRYS